ncbi:hypothetical protein C8Q70DRAFT_413438 [Cubamyces menziesii]|nr:hypothetical protein C8Q70DRAFT_413438 [Cubamyces menziesii]
MPPLLSPLPRDAAADELDPTLSILLISVIGITLLIPLLFAFWLTIPTAKRRTILYSTLLLTVVLALSEGALSIYLQIGILRKPEVTISRDVVIEITLIALIVINPIIAQCVLLLKIYTVYPVKALSYKLAAAIYTPAIGLKVARVVLVALTVRAIVKTSLPTKGTVLSIHIWRKIWQVPYANGVWCAQLADDILSTIVLASRIIRDPPQGVSPEQSHSRLKALAVTNACACLVPILTDIAEVTFSCLPGPDKGHYAGIYTVLASSFVEVICAISVVICYEHLAILPLPPRTATLPDGVPPRTTTIRLISPLAKLPRIQLFQSSTDSLGSASSAGSMPASTTMYNSDRSDSLLAKKKWDVYTLPGSRCEPSVISGCGTIPIEGSEDRVFYAI